MRYLILLLSLLFLTACAEDPLPEMVCEDGSVCDVGDPGPVARIEPIQITPEKKTDPYFASYIQYLQNKAAQYGRYIDMSNVPVFFGDTSARGSSVVAFCAALNNGQRAVTVQEKFWFASTETRRLYILAHETAHCSPSLNRAHRMEYRTTDFTPISMMYTIIVKEAIFLKYQEEYWQELYTHLQPQLNWTSGNAEKSVDIHKIEGEVDDDKPIMAHHEGDDCELHMGKN